MHSYVIKGFVEMINTLKEKLLYKLDVIQCESEITISLESHYKVIMLFWQWDRQTLAVIHSKNVSSKEHLKM